jgi:hypothetical protein
MGRGIRVVTILLSFGVLFGCFAQMSIKVKGSDGWGLLGRYEQNFNNYSNQTFSGQVTKVDTITPLRDMAYGIQLTVKTGDREQIVHLGPAWYLLHQDMNLSVKDNVEIKGCNTTVDGKQVIIAIQVRNMTSRATLYLRDQDGKPNWCVYRKD